MSRYWYKCKMCDETYHVEPLEKSSAFNGLCHAILDDETKTNVPKLRNLHMCNPKMFGISDLIGMDSIEEPDKTDNEEKK